MTPQDTMPTVSANQAYTGPVTAAEFNNAMQGLGQQKKRKKRGPKNQRRPEEVYADLIKAGQVRVERRRGKPPLIIWL